MKQIMKQKCKIYKKETKRNKDETKNWNRNGKKWNSSGIKKETKYGTQNEFKNVKSYTKNEAEMEQE